MNERNATAAQEANRAEYNCVCGRPLRLQVVLGNGWYKALCEQSSAHKTYMCAGQKWVDNRGRKKATTPTKAGSTKATSIKVFCSPPKTSANIDSGLRGNVSAPGIFLDPCPSSGLLGGALRWRT